MKPRIPCVLALAVAVMLGWWLFANSAERQIRKLFDQVSHEIAKTGPEHPFQALSKAKALAQHVGSRLSIDGLGGRRDLILDHESLPQQIALFRRELQTFSVEFGQLTVKVADDGTAQAFCNATCSDLPSWADDKRAYALTATLAKNDSGDWQFTAIHFAPLVP
ncbi:MAG: hypothetical protein IJ658_00925 [Kiritimatiellae bacterium]|nr:hypothetical protein [Kiritimatiellia bacterium]